MRDFFEEINLINKNTIPANQYSPLVLAYVGDAVFEMCVRTMVVTQANAPVNILNKKTRGYVNAKAQSEMFYKIKDILTEEELFVMKRGRNAKSFTTAKNSTISDYRHATGLEALFGYLYLKGSNKRIIELFKQCIENKPKGEQN